MVGQIKGMGKQDRLEGINEMNGIKEGKNEIFYLLSLTGHMLNIIISLMGRNFRCHDLMSRICAGLVFLLKDWPFSSM